MENAKEPGKTADKVLVIRLRNIFMNQEIFDKVKNIVKDQLDAKDEDIIPEANFASDLNADSLDTVELVMALEEEFDIEIPDEAAEQITTVGAAVEHIAEKLETPA